MTDQEIIDELEQLFSLGVSAVDAIKYFEEQGIELNRVNKLLLKSCGIRICHG